MELEKLIDQVNSIVWGPIMLILLFGTHIFLTIRLGFIQRYIGLGIKLSVSREEGKGDISQFAALATALAATIGTGNVVGVATAISIGGPGAVLWMWLTGVFGIATKYAESLLSIKFREIDKNGQIVGGPMFVLERGLGMKWLGVLFAIFTVIASFGIGNMVQANSISHLMKDTYGIEPVYTGIALAILTALVIIGGIKSIAKVSEALVPFMAVFYVISLLVIIVLTWEKIPQTLYLIVTSAFTGQSAIGGFAGAGVREAIRAGVARGLFSNESGLGSAPIVAAAAKTKNAVRQALVSSTGTFWDTVIICALTGIAIINTESWTLGLKGAEITNQTFSILGGWGSILLSISLLLFVFSTILGWSYYGEKALEYLLGVKSIMAFRILWVIFVIIGSLTSLNVVWGFADIANGLMAIPNLISLLWLHSYIKKETDKFLSKEKIDEEDPELVKIEVFDK
ncbi:MAG: sodium:alanine symporter family protein [Leptospiraceae bacterium]|nr:sodium:alanine symporter family protein [Leptospiraceae bacterium]MDW7976530.1 sodium:alanine symporter family protein [Leptospiraceae bacterium]